jgi:membrane-bound lytic murein transglycosylase B
VNFKIKIHLGLISNANYICKQNKISKILATLSFMAVVASPASLVQASEIISKSKNSNTAEIKQLVLADEEQSRELLEQQIAQNLKKPKDIVDPQEVAEAAEFASSVTGVRKDFLMGMLVVESNLGQNTGKCTYSEVEKGAEASYKSGKLGSRAWQTFKQRRQVIRDVADNLGYDYEQLNVSCNPSNYAGTGGAMGVPQFMPDTWLEYKDRISQIVGKDNPDPWDMRDGAVAMALKLSDVPGVKDHSLYAERNAAKMYLSGNTSWRYDWYANQIMYWANNYDKMFG